MKAYININGVDLVSGVNVLNIKYPAGYTIYMRSGTPADTVIIILEGKISCTVPGAGEYELLPGYVTAFPKYTERTSSYVADTRLLSIHITSAKPLFRDGVRQMRIEAMDSRQRGRPDLTASLFLPPIYEGVRCERLKGAGSAGGEADTVTAVLPAIPPD